MISLLSPLFLTKNAIFSRGHQSINKRHTRSFEDWKGNLFLKLCCSSIPPRQSSLNDMRCLFPALYIRQQQPQKHLHSLENNTFLFQPLKGYYLYSKSLSFLHYLVFVRPQVHCTHSEKPLLPLLPAPQNIHTHPQ